MDRRPLRPALPADGGRYGLARRPAVAAGGRTTRRLRIALGGVAGVALLASGAVLLWLTLRPERRHAAPPRPGPLLVGVDDDSLKWSPRPREVVRRQRSVGAAAVRVWVPWHGEREPGATRRVELARAAQASHATDVVLAIFGFAAQTPTTAAARARFCRYAQAVVRRVPDARGVVVWNEANSPTYWSADAAAYERLLARCHDALHAVAPDVVVLDSTASAHAPEAFLRAAAAAYRASGRTRRLVDVFGHNPYPRASPEEPAAAHAEGFLGEGDYGRLASLLDEAFAGTAQSSHLDLWYLEDGFQSRTSGRSVEAYTGDENAATVAATVQAERLGRAILLAACQPRVKAFFNFELVDESRLAGWQSGLFWRDGTAKPAAAAFAAAARAARTGDVDCGAAGGTADARP